jgi:23S rRNA (cytosine1962-C5)-methyltransferase
MTDFPRLILHSRKTDAVRRYHPWIFSGAIKKTEGELREGAIVEVYSEQGEFLASGHYGTGSIAVKIFSYAPVTDLELLFAPKLQAAYNLRQQIGLVDQKNTNCYRLVNAEGDGLPGLIIDWYNGVAVIQAHSIGMYEQRHHIAQHLKNIYGTALKAVYDKSAAILFKQTVDTNEYLIGESSTGEILEYDHHFLVDWETGQKTGFFIDQREHRALLSRYAQGKKVLNTFCYSGGFSVYALKAGAKQVDSIDSSAKAIELTKENIQANHLDESLHHTYLDDVFTFLKHCDADYDLIVLDPPAFAKNLAARHHAVMAYKRLNQLALSKLNPSGLLFTFSCSQVVVPEYFNGAVMAAAIETGRPTRILHHLTQPADHPVSIYHPEGLYLKGLVIQAE